MASLFRRGPISYILDGSEEEEEEKREDNFEGERPIAPAQTLVYNGQDTSAIDKKQYSKVIVDTRVAAIEDEAFSEWESLNEVEFRKPSQVVRIGRDSFTFCTALRSIEIPASVKIIERFAFMGSGVERFDFEDSAQLECIGDNAFEACGLLWSITIPVSVKAIGEGAFRNSALQQIEFETPSELEVISDDAFAGCESFQEIQIPSSVKTIGNRAFKDCALIRVEFLEPPQLQRIGNFAFERCEHLPGIKLPSSLVSLMKGSFQSCSELKSINFPPSLKYVGHGCFSQCRNLGQLTMHLNSKTTFGYAAFEDCALLKTIVSIDDKEDEKRLFSSGISASSMRELKGQEQQDLLKQILDGTGRYDDFVATMFESRRFVLRGLSRQLLDLITKRIFKSRRMQNCLSRLSVERAPVLVMMLDGYMNAALVSVFIYASNSFLLSQRSQEANIAILFISGYFLLRELQQLHSYGLLLYIDNSWNGVDCLRVVLAVSSAICMQTTSGGEDVRQGVRNLLLCTGIVLIGGLILFLRTTVLPFAEFVGGLSAILWKLFPFLVVSSLLLFAFSYMYFTTEGLEECSEEERSDIDDEEENFCTLSDSMWASVSFFFRGPGQTTTWQDVLFGIIIVVVLLNVVIAIVSDAWAESTQQGRALFWAYRIGFLEEVESLVARIGDWYCCSIHLPRLVLDLFHWVDGIGSRSIRDRVNWESEPYNSAKEDFAIYHFFCNDRAFALKTFDMSLADMEKLLEMGSFERDWYWANRKKTAGEEFFIEEEGVFVAEATLPTRRAVITNFLWYLLFLFLGLPTCGLLWPRRVRRMVFGVGKSMDDNEANGPSQVTPTDIREMESRLQVRLESRVEAVETRVAMLESSCQSQYEKLEAKVDKLIGLLEQRT